MCVPSKLATIFFFFQPAEKRDHFEVSPESGVIMDYLATFLRRKGGIVLVADYGHDGDGKDTFRVSDKMAQNLYRLQCHVSSIKLRGVKGFYEAHVKKKLRSCHFSSGNTRDNFFNFYSI